MTYDTFEREGWTVHKRAYLGRAPIGAYAAFGWEFSRDKCGCLIQIGMRLDKMEPIAGMSPCAKHDKACDETIRYMKETPPSEREVVEMMIEFYEAWLEVGERV